MYDIILLKTLKKMPAFSLSDVAKITKSRNYSKKLLRRLVSKGIIQRIMRDRYTFQDDLFVLAPHLSFPSYISCASALSYHGHISQIPNALFLMTTKRPKTIENDIKLIYHHTKYYFGFEYTSRDGIKVPIADSEKAIVDSIGIHPLHIFVDALDEINQPKLLDYAKRMKQIKRIGYLLEKQGVKVEIPKKISNKYIYLDPLGPKKGVRDKKWKLIVNY